jgi:hypothetical protein
MMNRISRQLLFAFFIFLPASVYAAGAILVDSDVTGNPVIWKNGIVRFNLESGSGGTLGKLSNTDATALVRDLFNDWHDVTIEGQGTVAITLSEGTGLGSVDVNNMNDHFTYCPPDEDCPSESSPFVLGSARSGESPILFDDDGSMTDAVQGDGASQSILGFAGPRVIERSGGQLYITEGQAILNGKFINNISNASDPEVSVDAFKGAIFHELGHFIGLDHTQVNLSSVVKYLQGDKSEKDAIPTMLPLFVDGGAQLSPHFDDKVAVSLLYPTSSYGTVFCRIQGKVFEEDGETELQGVNVVVSNPDDPLVEKTSFVSGAYYTGSSSGCNAKVGDFLITGLTPGRSYSISIETISQAFKGGSSIEPCDPPQTGFDAETIPGTFSCSSGGTVIAADNIITTRASSAQDGANKNVASSGGGCTLIPED